MTYTIILLSLGRFVLGGYVAVSALFFLLLYLRAQRQRKRQEQPHEN